MTPLPWSHARRLCERGCVTVDGQVARDPALRLRAGQRVEISQDPLPGLGREGEVPIVHVDREVVVVDKPAGLVTVPFADAVEEDTLVRRVELQLRRRFGPCPPVRVVQRLDRDTTGILVFARTRRAERLLQSQFREHTVGRRYLGLALGRVASGRHESLLVPDRGDGLRGSWRGPRPPSFARRAITVIEAVQVLTVPASLRRGALSEVTLVSCTLETGRQHQIRIHLSEAGHPLVGERVYVREYRGGHVLGFEPGQGRPLLHAERLAFVHPRGVDAIVRFEAALPPDFAAVLDALAPG